MRHSRLLAAAAAASVLAVGPLAAFAEAGTAPAGVGTGNVSSTAISVELGSNGDVLSVRILGDDGTSTVDPAKGRPVSSETLRPLTITSKVVPALNVSVAPVATSSTGSEDKKTIAPTLPDVPGFSGSLNGVLASSIDATGAHSVLQAGLANLKIAGGLVNVPTGVVQVASAAAPASASGNRVITIPDVRVLDLSAVLSALGLDLGNLSVNQLLSLLKGLGITLPGIVDPSAAVGALNSAIDTVKASPAGPLTAQVCNSVDGLLNTAGLGGVTGLAGGAVSTLPQAPSTVVGQLPPAPSGSPIPPGVVVPVIPPVVAVPSTPLVTVSVKAAALPAGFSCANLTGATVTDLLNLVQGTLGKLLGGVLANLGSTPLLSVKDVKVSLVASAADTVGHSVADVSASIGSVKVGNLAVPGVSGLDLTAPLATINQASTAIQGAVNGILATLNASLANLVKVDVLKIDKVVGSAGGYTTAASTVTALKATLTPPAVLGAALIDLSVVPTSTVLGTLTTAVPPLAPAMGQLKAALGGLNALTGPSVVTVGLLSADAAFRPAAADVPATGSNPPGGTPPGGTLPRTGGDAALPAMLAVALAGGALAIRRLLRSAVA